MDFDDQRITIDHLQGQLLTLSAALAALLKAQPDPHGAWLSVSNELADWLGQQEALAEAPPQVLLGMRDMSAFLSMQAPRAAPPGPGGTPTPG